MSTPHNLQPLSNDPDDFVQSGLYPGGTGIIEDIAYSLWDYNGTRPPDSEVAVKAIFKPTDGSNEGKDVEIYWSVGPSSEFNPSADGGFVFPVGTAAGMRNSSNWYYIGVALRDNCAMEKGKLNGPAGIKALIGSQMTLIRKDQPAREGLAKSPAPGQQDRKPTFLVPTFAIFPWDAKGGARRPAARPARAAAAPGPVAVPAPVTPVPAPAPRPVAAAPVNGANNTVDVDTTIAEVLAEILNETEGNAIQMGDTLSNAVLGKIGPQGRGVVVKQRMAILSQLKDPAYLTNLAAAQGWQFDGTFLATQ